MLMHSLLDIVEKQDQNRLALITPTRQYHLADLTKLARKQRALTADANRYAVVNQKSIVEFIVNLLAFDGQLKAILIQPTHENINPEWYTLVRSEEEQSQCSERFTTWIMSTSGTTGVPKLISHKLPSLTSTTKFDDANGARHRWGLLYDPARFAGMQVLLQALVGGGVLVAPDLEGSLDSNIEFMVEHGVTSLSATPSYWRKILMSPSAEVLRLTQITLGGEIADQSILSALRRQFPEGRIVHIYASTEVGVGFSVRDGKAGFPVSYMVDDVRGGTSLRISTDNHLMIRKIDMANNEFIDTGDIVAIQADRVHFLGRASGAINVGGNKVLPEAVEAVLLSHPEVVAARVLGIKNSFMGNLVVAEIELAEFSNAETVLKSLNELCCTHLERWQRPAKIRVLDSISIAASGKLSRVISYD